MQLTLISLALRENNTPRWGNEHKIKLLHNLKVNIQTIEDLKWISKEVNEGVGEEEMVKLIINFNDNEIYIYDDYYE